MSPRVKPSNCAECVQLLQACDKATSEFSDAVHKLNGHKGALTRSEYNRLRAAVERTRLAADNARALLYLHRAEHGASA
jgi:hypothetical protein